MGAGEGGKYRVALDSDTPEFGGLGRVGHDTDHFTQPEGIPGTLFSICFPPVPLSGKADKMDCSNSTCATEQTVMICIVAA